MSKVKTKYYCIEGCGTEIHYETWRIGQGRCRPCSSKEHSKKMIGRKRPEHSKQMKGKNNPNYIDGRALKKYFCECGKEINYVVALYCGGNCGLCADKKHSIKMRGKNCPSYIDGRTPLIKLLRSCEKYFKWRTKCFKRDNFTCQECGKKDCYINVDHIKPFKIIFENFLRKYNKLNPSKDKYILYELALKYKAFWNIINGRTLCESCHKVKTKNDHKRFELMKRDK